MGEAAAAEIARRSFGVKTPELYGVDPSAIEGARSKNIARVGAIGYKGAENAPGADDPIVDRAKPYIEALEGAVDEKTGKRAGGILSRAKTNENGDVDVRTVRTLSERERDTLTDIFGRIAKKNDTMQPRTLAEVVYDIANPKADEIMGRGPKVDVDWRNKTITYNGRSFYADEQTMLDLAKMRGEASKQFFKAQGDDAKKRRAAGEKKDNEDEQNRQNPIGSAPAQARAGAVATNLDTQISRLEEGLRNPNMPPRIKADNAQMLEQLTRQRDALRNRLKATSGSVR
jgi:hypothetical protein